MGKLQALATSRTLIRSVLNASTPLDSWVHDQGHIVLLGDACHPMLVRLINYFSEYLNN